MSETSVRLGRINTVSIKQLLKEILCQQPAARWSRRWQHSIIAMNVLSDKSLTIRPDKTLYGAGLLNSNMLQDMFYLWCILLPVTMSPYCIWKVTLLIDCSLDIYYVLGVHSGHIIFIFPLAYLHCVLI